MPVMETPAWNNYGKQVRLELTEAAKERARKRWAEQNLPQFKNKYPKGGD